MKNIIKSSIMILGMLTLIGGLTVAYFNDTEIFKDNIFKAGAIDLKIDNTSYYNGQLSETTTWQNLADFDDLQGPSGDGQYKFFNFSDLKPGDWGSDAISLHVFDNPSWMCSDVILTENLENDLLWAEHRAGDIDGDPLGELPAEINFVWWIDDGDSVLEDDETVISQSNLGDAPLNIPVPVTLADSTKNIWNSEGGAFPENTVKYIGKAWCYGEMTLSPVAQGENNTPLGAVQNSGFNCDNDNVTNISQTDSAIMDVSFYVIQQRHEENFTCPSLKYPVTVTKSGNGTGSVVSDVTGIDCGGDCSEDYYRTSTVTLTATPSENSDFIGWSGDCTGTGECVLGINDEAKNVNANFAIKTFTLSLTKSGTGTGWVYSSPSGINCGTTCSKVYNYGATVTLFQSPYSQSVFAGWGGDCSGTESCSVTMNQARNVTVTFNKIQYVLTTNKSGSGNGLVTSSPTGINCGATCSASFDINSTVDLTASADSSSAFDQWNGCWYVSGGICHVRMDAAKSVTAYFNSKLTFTASADTFVSSFNPTTSYGSYSYLDVNDGWYQGDDRWSFIKFNLSSGMPPLSLIKSAALKFYVNSESGFDSVEIRPVTSSWSESTTYNSSPSYDTASATSLWINTGWNSVDVTDWVKQNKINTHGVRLETFTQGSHKLSSREGVNDPILEIVY